MKTSVLKISAAAVLAAAAWTPAAMAEEVKVGIIASISGPFSIWGREYKEGIDLFMDKVGGKAGNNTMSIVYRDVGGGIRRAHGSSRRNWCCATRSPFLAVTN